MAAPLDLDSLSIMDIRVKGAVNGGLLMEVFAGDSANAEAAADSLAARVREILADLPDILVGRPHKFVDVRGA